MISKPRFRSVVAGTGGTSSSTGTSTSTTTATLVVRAMEIRPDTPPPLTPTASPKSSPKGRRGLRKRKEEEAPSSSPAVANKDAAGSWNTSQTGRGLGKNRESLGGRAGGYKKASNNKSEHRNHLPDTTTGSPAENGDDTIVRDDGIGIEGGGTDTPGVDQRHQQQETRPADAIESSMAGLEEGMIINRDQEEGRRGGDYMLSATLVNEEEIVEAKPAPEGFEALRLNKKLKYLLVAIFVAVLIVIIPVAVVVPNNQNHHLQVSNSNSSSTTGLLECGTARTNQADYRGSINITEAGIPCQHWASQFPNSHAYDPERYPAADLSENYCRNPDGDVRPWCIANETGRSQKLYCSVPFCDGEATVNTYLCGTIKARKQADYRGTINTTITGKTCQRWDSQEPHFHPNTPDAAPLAGLEANYCRNPDGEPAAWCYTTDNNTRWEFCRVPMCEVLYYNGTTDDDHAAAAHREKEEAEAVSSIETCGSPDIAQADYRGNINFTLSGRTCQPWDSQVPQEHTRTPENYPQHGLVGNFCRNPDGEPAAWCYTTDPEKRWEFCDVPDCPSSFDLKQCGTYDWKQQDYVGTINITQSGHPCQPWAAQSPHFHYEIPALYPNANLVGNYCRNPTGDERGAWCYTNSSDVVWDYCDVPYCMSEEERQKTFVCGSRSKNQADYRGIISRTEYGRRCQYWDSNFPHDPGLLSQGEYPSLEANYCRNPNGNARAWCLTTDLIVRFEYCDVPYCEDIDIQEEEEEEEEPCMNCTSTKCGSTNQQQADYRGPINVTETGLPCQAWIAQYPHKHSRTPDEYPEADLTGNACRNPDDEERAWCYTTNNLTRWEFCSVPFCT